MSDLEDDEPYVENELDELMPCIRDDSTDCDCPRCVGAEDRFWDDQGEDRDRDNDDDHDLGGEQ